MSILMSRVIVGGWVIDQGATMHPFGCCKRLKKKRKRGGKRIKRKTTGKENHLNGIDRKDTSMLRVAHTQESKGLEAAKR